MPTKNISKLAAILFSSTLSSLAYGSGFAIMEQGVSGLGRSYAGAAAVADDASTIAFNPAGLTYLTQTEVLLANHFIIPKGDFSDEGSTLPATVGGGPLSGTEDDNGKDALVPSFYYARAINETMTAGFGITAPFGLVTEYDDDWKGRYHALRSGLKTININPSLAFKANDKLSLGFGINLQYADVELTQAVDFGTVCQLAGAGACATPGAYDGKVKLTLDDWSWGYNLGLLYQATDATRLGLAFRSKIAHNLRGEGKFRIPTNATVQATAAAADFRDGDIHGRLTVPESASFAIHHQINSQFAIMIDGTWTRWSRFDELAIQSNDVTKLNSIKEEDWKNSMRYAIGLDYKHNEQWTFRTGVAYDETPIPGVSRRTPRIAGNNRTWLSFGGSYHLADNLIIDGAYTHLFIKDPKINDESSLGHSIVGEYEASVDILGLQVRWLLP